MVKHVMRLVLALSAASLLYACGVGETPVPEPVAQATVSKSLSLSLSLSPAVQCSDVATIAAGAYHTVGLKNDGTVVAVGKLGDRLNVSSWTNIKAIAAGTNHTVGLKNDGTVVAVGEPGNQLNVSTWTNIKAIAAGANHTVGLKNDGTVVAVGDDNGQLNVSSWTNIKAIAAGWYHTVGLKDDGTVVAVGYTGNDLYDYGQLNVSSWTNIKAIAAGTYHTVGLKTDETVTAVGYNYYGQRDVSSWKNIKAIAAGAFHTVGLNNDGTATAVGYNYYGQRDDVSSWTNMMPICDPAGAVNLDVTPPITISMMTGTLGNNDWYVSDVQMTLTATDNDGGSGVKEIHYIVDNTETVVPGSSASTSIVGDGTHPVTFYAIDNAGNEEAHQTMSINIDKTSPSISLAANSSILWPPNHKMVNVLIGGSVDDGVSGSEIASTIITVTDEYGIYNRTVPNFGSAVPLEAWREDTDMDGRSYTITAVTTDNAGNQTQRTTTVRVPHDMRK